MREELACEVEALEAIFGPEYTVLENEGMDNARFEILLNDDELGVRSRLVFGYTPGYPDKVPNIVVQADAGLSAPRRIALQRTIEEEAMANLSTPMIFTLHAAAKEWISRNLVGDGNEDEDLESDVTFETRDEEQEKSNQAQEMKKFHGTPVTAETFAEWRERFEWEVREQSQTMEKKHQDKPTGRDYFMQNKAIVTEEAEAFWEAEAAMYDNGDN